jgi:hypothetical protein
MSEAEALELVLMAIGNCVAAFTVYVSVIFGYLVAAFLVGDRLSTLQVIISGGLFTFAAMSCTFTISANLSVVSSAADSAPTLFPRTLLTAPGLWQIYMTPLMTLGVAASLWFMRTIRLQAAASG